MTKRLTSTSCTYLNQQKEENDSRKYFMINLHESMGPGLDQTHNPGSALGLPLSRLHYGDGVHVGLYEIIQKVVMDPHIISSPEPKAHG